MSWHCIFCSCFTALSLFLLLSHYNSYHTTDVDFYASCGIDGCTRAFTKANSFAKHVRTKHRQHLQARGPEDFPCQGEHYWSIILFRLVIVFLFKKCTRWKRKIRDRRPGRRSFSDDGRRWTSNYYFYEPYLNLKTSTTRYLSYHFAVFNIQVCTLCLMQ